MNALAEVRRENSEQEVARGWMAWPLLALLAALLVAHIGCHGDEDNELFLRHGSTLQTK